MSPDYSLNTKELQERIETYSFELAYERALGATAQILGNEAGRRLRVELLLMETEKNELGHRLDKKIEALEDGNLRTQFELRVAARDLEKVNLDLRACSRTNDALNVEMRSVKSNSAVLLAEKAALDCEIASLRDEVQNLKSQAGLHQTVLLENLALERRLASLQQELETLKRSTQAAQQVSQLEDERLQNQLKSLGAELDGERYQRVRAEENTQKVSSEWESKYTTLELRSNSFRNKLRVTMEQLKACQAELRDSHTNGPSEPGPLVTGPGRKGFAKPSLKRSSVQQLDADSMIGTPGDMPAAKKTKRGLTLPGDKSAFSITPFLNRASSVALESPSSEVGHITSLRQKEKSYDHLDDQGESDEAVINVSKETRAISKITGPPAQAAQPKPRAIGSRGKPNTKTSLMRNSRISLSLEDVSETEENDQNDPLLVDRTTHKSAEEQRRKRKVFAGRLHKPALKDDQTRKLATVGREQMPPTSASTFGVISPLKRKRKPVLIDPRDATG